MTHSRAKKLVLLSVFSGVLIATVQPAFASDSTSTEGSGIVCPASLHCASAPAAHEANSEVSTNYGNYDPAHRPQSTKIDHIVIHDTEGTEDATIESFQDPATKASSNYVIGTDGTVTQTVNPEDVSWGDGNWWNNTHAINIEHVGVAVEGKYTEAEYKSSATLVRYLARKYGISLDRQHIIGHDEVLPLTKTEVSGVHYDPGPYWDWNAYMTLVTGKQSDSWSKTARTGDVVTINPSFDENQVAFKNCDLDGTCTQLPEYASSAVQLHAQPSDDSALVTDDYVQTTPDAISNWTTTASTGQQFVVAKTQGEWTGIYYNGKVAWLSKDDVKTVKDCKSTTLKTSKNTPIYGAALPETGAYPSDIPVRKFDVLYTAPAGQSYVAIDKMQSDYYYSQTVDQSKPGEGTVVVGKDKYYAISFNHRIGYVKASDVEV